MPSSEFKDRLHEARDLYVTEATNCFCEVSGGEVPAWILLELVRIARQACNDLYGNILDFAEWTNLYLHDPRKARIYFWNVASGFTAQISIADILTIGQNNSVVVDDWGCPLE